MNREKQSKDLYSTKLETNLASKKNRWFVYGLH